MSEDITTAFNDPTTGASLAEQQIGQDVDVIFQVAGLSGQGALEAACDAGGVYGIGVDVDQALALPSETCIVTSAEKKLVDAVDEAIQRVVDGEAVGGSVVLDAASDPPKVGGRPRSTTIPTCSRRSCRRCSTTRRPRWHPASSNPCEGEGACPATSPNSARIGLSIQAELKGGSTGPALLAINARGSPMTDSPSSPATRPRARDAGDHQALSRAWSPTTTSTSRSGPARSTRSSARTGPASRP